MNLMLVTLAIWAAQHGPEQRALNYLAREVPRWAAKHKCYSCHNNGDAARTLYLAHRLGRRVPPQALADTTRWLERPTAWDDNKGDPAFSDKHLARLQFAVALREAIESGTVKDRQPLTRAAELVVESQHKDGSWRIGAEGNVGGSVTYGPVLATALAKDILHTADAKRHRQEIERAEQWLLTTPVETVLDAAAGLLTLQDVKRNRAGWNRQQKCLAVLRKGQSDQGGWGPYLNAPPEPFDTAVVLLALAHYRNDPEYRPMIAKGRDYLIATQRWDGSWPETTRPAGAESYAQRVSTTAWATRALLMTPVR